MRIGIDDILAGHGIGTGGGSGGGRLEPKSARVTTTNVTQVVDIPASLGFNPAKDMMMVFQNSVFIDKGTDYTLAEDATTIIATDRDWTVGTIFDFLVITNTKTDLPTYDGSLIGDGTITESKLSQAILERIEASSNFDAVLGRVNEVELKMRQLREVAANAQLQMEATELVSSGQSFGGNGNFSFGAPMDTAKTTTTNILDAGATVLSGKVAKHDAFAVGQTVTIYDDVNTEAVVVTKATTTELEVSALVNGYKSGAVIARSTLVPHVSGGYDFPKWNAVKGPGVARFNLGTSDEAVLWTTLEEGLTSTVKEHYFGKAPKIIENIKIESLNESLQAIHDETALDIELLNLNNQFKVQSFLGIASNERILTDFEGTIYATAGNSVTKLSPRGKTIWVKNNFVSVRDMCLDASNNIYVVQHSTDPLVKGLIKLNSNGEEVWSKTNLYRGTAIKLDKENNLIYAQYGNAGMKNLIKFDVNGNEIWSNTSLTQVWKMDVAKNGKIAIAHSQATPGTPQIRMFSPQGVELWNNSSNTYGDIVKFDSRDNLMVAYSNTAKVIKYDEFGVVLSTFSTYAGVRDMALDKLDNFYLSFGQTDVSAAKVAKYSSSGALVWNDTSQSMAMTIHVDEYGTVYVGYLGGSTSVTIQIFDGSGNELWSDSREPNSRGIAVTDTMEFYVSNFNSLGSKTLRKFDIHGRELWNRTDLNSIQSVKVDKHGFVYTAGAHGVYKLNAQGDLIWNNNTGISAEDLAIDNNQNVIVIYSTVVGNKVVRKLNPQGQEIWSLTDIGTASSVDTDSEGNIYVTYRINNANGPTLRKLNANGVEIWRNSDIAMANHVVVDQDDFIYVAYANNTGKTVVKRNSNGVEVWANYSAFNARRLAVDSDKNVFVTLQQTQGELQMLQSNNGVMQWRLSLGEAGWGVAHDKNRNLYVTNGGSGGFKNVRKLGKPRKLKTWVITKEQDKLVFRNNSPIGLKLYINNSLVDSLSPSERHSVSLDPDRFIEGTNRLLLEINGLGKEIWTVNRSGQRLTVHQWTSTNIDSLPLELELALEGEGKLHKYLGAIG